MSKAIGITGYLPGYLPGVDDPATKVGLTRASHRRSSLTPSQRRGIATMQQAMGAASVEADATLRRVRTAALRPSAQPPSQRPIAATPTLHVSSLRLSQSSQLSQSSLRPLPQPPATDAVVTGNWPPQYLGVFMLLFAIVAVGGVMLGAKYAKNAEWASPAAVVDEGGVDAAVEPAPAGWR